MRAALKSKTIWFAVGLASLGVVEQNTELLRPLLTPGTYGLFTIGVGVAVAVLRVVTTVPLSGK